MGNVNKVYPEEGADGSISDRVNHLAVPNLAALCAEWQGILRLQDWDVCCRWGNRMELPDHWGQCRTQMPYKQALVLILDPTEDTNGGNLSGHFPYDPEVTLVHELLHLHMLPIEESGEWSDKQDDAQEQFIDILARALVKLKRRR